MLARRRREHFRKGAWDSASKQSPFFFRDFRIFIAVELPGSITSVAADLSPVQGQPAQASIYQLDGVVRRAPSLQLTADARAAQEALA